MSSTVTPQFEEATYSKAAWRLIPFLFLHPGFPDRVNVGFAKLQMSAICSSAASPRLQGRDILIGYSSSKCRAMMLERLARVDRTHRGHVGLISTAFMFTGDIHWGPIAAWFNCTDASSRSISCASGSVWPRRASSGCDPLSRALFPGARRAKMVAVHDGDRCRAVAAHRSPAGSAVHGRHARLARLAVAVPGRVCRRLLSVLVLAILPNGPRTATG